MDILADLKANLQEFEDFVDDYTQKMNDILSGKITDEDRDWAKRNIEGDVNERAAKAADQLEVAPVPKQEVAQAAETADLAETERPCTRTPSKSVVDYSKWEKLKMDEDEVNPKPESSPPSKASKQQKQPPRTSRADEIRKKADVHRLKGNQLMKEQMYREAVTAYTTAINIYFDESSLPASISPPKSKDAINTGLLEAALSQFPNPTVPPDVALYTNRALAYLRLHEWQKAVKDCTEALKLDGGSVKAMWRRAEAHRSLKEFEKARDDLENVRRVVVAFLDSKSRKGKGNKMTGNEVIADPGVTLEEVDRALKTVEKEIADVQSGIRLEKEVEQDGTKVLMETLLDELCTKIPSAASQSPLRSTSTTLSNLFDTTPALSDIFRVCRGFDRLVSGEVLTPRSIDLILPILLSACRTSDANRREMARHTSALIRVLFETPNPDITVIETAACLLALCAADAVFVDTLAKTDVGGPKFGVLVLTFLQDSATAGVATSPAVAYHLLSLLSRMMAVTPVGSTAVTKTWGITPQKILRCLPAHLLSSAVVNNEPVSVVACECINKLCTLKGQPFPPTLTDPLIDAIFTVVNRKPQPTEQLTTLLATFHNLLAHSPHPISSLLTDHNILPMLISLLRTHPDLRRITTLSLAKLVKHHKQQIAETLDGWWDDVPKLDLMNTQETRGAAAQLLWAWLASGGERCVQEWKRVGGFQVLQAAVKDFADGTKSGGLDEVVVGNFALCLAECLRKADLEEHARYFATEGTIDHIIKLLKACKDAAVRSNLAIACARLCQIESVLERARELGGVELMYALGINKSTS
ncbi:Sperm associated antigen 1 [Borealophlyctis nickersoniae]|nr:Sperm associated antigen 1 [Borealophlyctis nickersoniae]